MYTEQLFQYVATNFDFAFVISINVVAYLIITLIGYITKKKVSKVIKIGITIVTSILLFLLYGGITDCNKEVLLNSSILAPVAWDWIIKPLCNWIKIDYKENID
jgi:hypothetical protein